MGNEFYKGSNKREFYRIRYPIWDRPVMKLDGSYFEVMDIAEKGIKFFCKECSEFMPDAEIQFTLTFHDNESLELEGTILRVYSTAVVIYLEEDIPLGRIIKEQQYILAKYSDNLDK